MTIKVKYLTKIEHLDKLSDQEKSDLQKVCDKFRFRANDYYLSLIDWDDPNDPIRQIIIPHTKELEDWGDLDPSNEKAYTIMPGLEHKYNSTAILLVSDVCDGVCRYCFRKRLFIEKHSEHKLDIQAALEYIKSHKEITNVLLTGGDPLMLTTSKLEEIIAPLREMNHVQIIRIGTRVPVFNPYRIIDDPALGKLIEKYSTRDKKIYMMLHFVHPTELTDVATEGINILQKSGAILANQTPLIRGLNDDPYVLADLLAKLSFIGVPPYYIFQCRPALGNKAYTVPIEQGYEIVEQAKSRVSGLAKRARYAMSHSTGKVEIVGKTDKYVYMKYHRAFDDADSGRFMAFKSNPQACWLDDYDQKVENQPIDLLSDVENPLY